MSAPLDDKFKQIRLQDYNDRFTFGKHKGQTIAAIIARDPQYVVWAHENVDFFKVKHEVLEVARDTVKEKKQERLTPDKPMFGRPQKPAKFLDDEADDDIPF